MKTLSFTLGLMLLVALRYVAATPQAVNVASPESCCFRFFAKKIPKTEIVSIVKTHSSCSEKAFVFNTKRGPICVSQTLDWANKAFHQQQRAHGNKQTPGPTAATKATASVNTQR